MYCRKCGTKMAESDLFCPNCGCPSQQQEPGRNDGHRVPREHKKKARWPWIIVALVVLVIVIVGALFVRKQFVKKKYQEKLMTADKCLQNMDYKKAEDAYLEAIKIGPQEKESYIKLADLYITQDEPEKAAKILKTGIKNVPKKEAAELTERYSIYTYVDDVLIPDIGQCKEGDYECSYTQISEYGYAVDSVHSESGVLNWHIADYDNDGQEELLVLVMNNNAVSAMEGDTAKVARNEIDLQMYEMENGKVVKQDQYQGLVPVLGFGDRENDGIFLQKKDDTIYICGSCENTVYTFADGTNVKSFILTYQDGMFVEEAGQLDEASGSCWEDEDGTAARMADLAESIGLTLDAETIRTSCVPAFPFLDKVDKTLLRITGQNETFDGTMFFQQQNAENLGTVKLTLKYDALKSADESEDAADGNAAQSVDAYTYMAVYGPLLDDAVSNTSNEFGFYNTYWFYDIDKDGVKEILIQQGTCEADYVYDIYTIENGAAKYLGEIGGGHTSFYEDENGGTEPYIIQQVAHMGYETLLHISIQDGEVQAEVVSERELKEDESYYESSAVLPYASMDDKTLLSR